MAAANAAACWTGLVGDWMPCGRGSCEVIGPKLQKAGFAVVFMVTSSSYMEHTTIKARKAEIQEACRFACCGHGPCKS
jgi:hypothetical protein